MPAPQLSLFRHQIELRCTRALLRSPKGRAQVLARLWVYRQNLSVLPVELQLKPLGDPALDRLCERRRGQERRHAELFDRLLRDAGASARATDETLAAQPLQRLLQLPVEESCDVMWTFLTLQVLLETFIVVSRGIARAWARVDPAAAAVLESIAADDDGYLAYVAATAVRYEASPSMRELVLERLRKAHGRACSRTRLQELRLAAAEVEGPDRVALASLVRLVGLLPCSRLETVASRERQGRALCSVLGRA